jgi:predicted Zn-dependent protease
MPVCRIKAWFANRRGEALWWQCMRRSKKTDFRICTTSLLLVCAFFEMQGQRTEDDEFQVLLKQGFSLHQQAHFADAIPVLEHARQLQPGDYFANLLLGIDLLRIGKPADALPNLKLAARTKPDEEIPEEYLGEAEASLGHFGKAAEAYQEAVRRGHDSEQSVEAWADFALERFRQIGESLRASSAGVTTVRRLQEVTSKPALLECEGPIPALERRFATRPSSRESADLNMGYAYKLSLCYAVEAGKAAAQLQRNAEDVAAFDRLRGDVLLRLKGDAATAEDEYRKAIAIRPGDPGLLERLAEAQLTAGNSEGARQSALAAIAVDPHRREALRTLVSLAMSDRDYEQALPRLRQLNLEAPGDLTVQVDLGRALAQTGKAAEALQYLHSAMAAGYPDEKGSLHSLEARVLRELGHEGEAAKASAEARRLSDAFQARSKDGAHEKVNAD